MANQTVGQKIGQRVSDRWWPLRQAAGKNPDGSWRTLDAWVDMRSGQDGGEKRIAYHEDGHNGAPPPLASGDPGRQACWQPPSAQYRRNYLRIDWSA